MILDSDSSRQSIIINLLFSIIATSLFIGTMLKTSNVYILGNEFIMHSIEEKLFNEGYYIENVTKGIYLIHPVLY